MKFEEHAGWERTVPKYKAARDLHPSANDRFKFEPPFTDIADSDEYQYATHPIKVGQEIQTRDWPYPSLVPPNFAGQKILEFFNRALESRLPRLPFWARRPDSIG